MSVSKNLTSAITKKKHAIIGGLGGLGQHLRQTLLAEGHDVVVLDRHQPAQAEAILGETSKHVNYVPFTVGGDSPTYLAKSLQGVETVYSVVTPDVQFGTRRDFELVNHLGMKDIVQACKESADVRKLVYASSFAVTNLSIPSIQQDESHPLPPLDSYESKYDLTKRLGEDHILASNNPNGDSPLKTCSLRLGGLVGGPRDYIHRSQIEMAEKTGFIIGIETAKMDLIASSDVANAMIKASEKLDEDDSKLEGKALFVSKSRNETSPTVTEIVEVMAGFAGWRAVNLPSPIFWLLRNAAFAHYNLFTKPSLMRKTKNEDLLPGTPPHQYMTVGLAEQTFDNSRAHELLGWKPELSWEEAVEKVIQEYNEK